MTRKLKSFLELIKFEHSIFALPFAYLGMVLAGKSWPRWSVFWLVTFCMVSARSAGMLLNRIIDLEIDRKNPRTSRRPSVTGEVPLRTAVIGTAISLTIFFLSSFWLNPLCFKLSFAALVFLVGYHYVKRFSFLCHFTLGLVLAIAPYGAWIAVTGRLAWEPVFLSLAVLFWVAGFDILYSLQDLDFDRAHGLHSVPVRFGQKQALKISAYSHIATIVFLGILGLVMELGVIYWAGLLVVGVLLFAEHRLMKNGDLSYLNTAFFTINGWVGILLFVFSFLEIFR